MLDEAEREARLAETGAAGDEDEIRRLQAAGLRVERLQAGRHAGLGRVAALFDLRDVAVQRDLERHDVPVERRLAHREQQSRGILDGPAGVVANEREPRDLVRGADELPQLRGAGDDRGVGLGVRDRRDVLHESDEELRAADRCELVRRDELLLHRLERDLVAPQRDPLHRAEYELVMVAGEIGRRDATPHEGRVQRVIDEDRPEQRGLGLGVLRRRLRAVSDVERHTGKPSSSLREKKRACSASK